jgi:arabinogalactan endo-1,4-beta-galactosidase
MKYLSKILLWAGLMAALPAVGQDFRVSISVSPFTEILFHAGITFSDGRATARTPEELQRLFAGHGANEVFARIATTRKHGMGFGDHSMEKGLERARMARALNLPFNPELGLFDSYGDVRCQPAPDFHDFPEIKLPAEWSFLTVDQMVPALRRYGALAAREILATGVTVRIWDIGNEIELGTAGMAVQPMPGGCDDTSPKGWYKPPDAVDPAIGKMSVTELLRMPEGRRIAWLQEHVWPHEGRLLAAVAEGIRSVEPRARFSTHISGTSSVLPGQAVAFYKAMQKAGFLPDELGMSYYPTSSQLPPDRLAAFKDTATALKREFGRPVFVAELGYPSAKMESGFVWNDALKGYSQTPEGQASFIRDLAAWGAESGVLSGIRPWGPELAVSAWGPMSLFFMDGRTAVARPSLNAIAEGAGKKKKP